MKCFDFLKSELMVGSNDPSDAVELEPIVSARADQNASDESDSAADIWTSCGTFPPRTRYDHISRRRLRSRSSPIRIKDDKNGRQVRARSPSAYSPRRGTRDRSRKRFTQYPGPHVSPEYGLESATPGEEYMQASNYYWCGADSACGTAYFSLGPPAAPLRLVPVVTPIQPPKVPSMYSGVTRIARVSFAKTLNQEPTTCASSIDHTMHLETKEQISSCTCVKFRHSSMSTRSRGDRGRRSIAVQAKSTLNDDASYEQKLDAAPAQEWLGGVRALRDSHVRLVLRQLRHIERLNRALDRAARPPPPPPPSSPRAPPALTPSADVIADVQV